MNNDKTRVLLLGVPALNYTVPPSLARALREAGYTVLEAGPAVSTQPAEPTLVEYDLFKTTNSGMFGKFELTLREHDAALFDPSDYRDWNDPELKREQRAAKANPYYQRQAHGGRKSKNKRW